MQPTNTLHLGNYLGALKNWVRLQETMDCLYCVVDMHAITVEQDPKALAAATREVTAAYVASGVNPAHAILFNQSAVHEHAELAWIFNCVARMGWLGRMTQFKEKAGKHRENASVGLFVYPNLMAADILAYIAQKFNNDFAVPGFFPLPEPVITGAGTRVMSLRDGTKKMSKSDESDYSRINLTDDADGIAQKVRKARTDAAPLPDSEKGLEGRPEAENLINIYASLADEPRGTVIARFAGQQFSAFKNELADLAVSKLVPIAAEMRRLLADPAEVDALLRRGAEKARAIAHPIVTEVKHIVGFVS